LEQNRLPPDVIQFIDDPDRALVTELLRMHQYIDMLIPRGGASLHAFCRENSSIPVITGGIGICHLFVDDSARIQQALQVIRNAKIQRPSVCNALDTALIHRNIAREFIPALIALLEQDGVTIHAHESAVPYLNGVHEFRIPSQDSRGIQNERTVGLDGPAGSDFEAGEGVVFASPDDFDVEWLSLNLGIKVVENLAEAIEHIRIHSTGHSDGILTEDMGNAENFVRAVDSAVVYVNASTRFTDGGQLGLGAEVAVSTQRLHARGPMGLNELTTYKWIIRGNYHVRP
jgi:glutamate-5-semialdehyde dehydrogenase